MSSTFDAAARGKVFKPGDVIVHQWYQQFLLEDGNPDMVAIIMLGDIVAWYRSGTGAYGGYFGDQAPMLDGDALILSYDYFERKFGFKEDRSRRALARLDEHHVLKRGFKNIAVDGKRINKLVINLDLAFFESCFIDPELDIRGIRGKRKSGHLLSCDDQISTKTLEFKNRSTESNFCKNSFEEGRQSSTIGESKAGYSLASFYPLAQPDIQKLQGLCGREFSGNAINEILLSLSKKLPDHAFPNKKAFLSYMAKALAYEMRDAVKISNESFRIKNNITTEEQITSKQEAFLSQIENSRDTSCESQLSRKLAGVLETSVAYNFLLAASFPKGLESSEVTDFKIVLQRKLELSAVQYRQILAQVQAVYGSHINSLEFEITKQKLCLQHPSTVISSSITSTATMFAGVWGNIRRSLIKTNGAAVDQHWFSKLIPFVDETTRELKLKAPTSFVKDWITQNYQHLIENVCARENYRLVEVTV